MKFEAGGPHTPIGNEELAHDMFLAMEPIMRPKDPNPFKDCLQLRQTQLYLEENIARAQSEGCSEGLISALEKQRDYLESSAAAIHIAARSAAIDVEIGYKKGIRESFYVGRLQRLLGVSPSRYEAMDGGRQSRTLREAEVVEDMIAELATVTGKNPEKLTDHAFEFTIESIKKYKQDKQPLSVEELAAGPDFVDQGIKGAMDVAVTEYDQEQRRLARHHALIKLIPSSGMVMSNYERGQIEDFLKENSEAATRDGQLAAYKVGLAMLIPQLEEQYLRRLQKLTGKYPKEYADIKESQLKLSMLLEARATDELLISLAEVFGRRSHGFTAKEIAQIKQVIADRY